MHQPPAADDAAARVAVQGTTYTAELLAVAGPATHLVGRVPELVDQCLRVQVSAAGHGSAPVDLATLDVPDLGDDATGVAVTTVATEPGSGCGGPGRCSTVRAVRRPDLLQLTGVGPIVAATVLTAWSHSGRCPDDAAFALLAGAVPTPASSGRTVRHRLTRAGDRQLDRALHAIALCRLQRDPRTRAYADRRRAQGGTDREIERCLEGYIARELHRPLKTPLAAA